MKQFQKTVRFTSLHFGSSVWNMFYVTLLAPRLLQNLWPLVVIIFSGDYSNIEAMFR
jgi:hypothetical protein